jgi:uncharacterized protein
MPDHGPLAPRRLALHTADGLALQAEWAAGNDPAPRIAVVLTHPHPLHGGTMYASVVDALFGTLPGRGVGCLRFNFRGVQGSQGRHDYGRGEQSDVRAALDVIGEVAPGLPVAMIGYSFGADVALALDDPRITAWVGVAPPLRVLPPEELRAGTTGRPVLLLVPTHDQFCGPDEAAARVRGWDATRIEAVPMADHFLAGAVSGIVATVDEFLEGLLV